MKKLLVGLLAATSIVGTAEASMIDGRLSIFGAVNIDVTNHTVKQFNALALPSITSGDFDVLAGPQIYHPQNAGVYIPWTQYGTLSDLACGASCIYSISNGAVEAHLNMLTMTVGYLPGIDFTLLGTGIMYMTGKDPTEGTFSLTLQIGDYGRWNAWQGSSFDPSPVPGPIVGAGIPGLVGMLGVWWWRRRQKIV